MKTQLFQPIKNWVKNISFIRNSIMSPANDLKAQQQKQACLNALHGNTTLYQLKLIAQPGLIPAALNNKAGNTVIGTTNIKNSFMRTFVRKSGIFAMALLIANLFLLNNSMGQTTIPITTSGNLTIPGGVTSVTVKAWGGGGAGGGATNNNRTTGGGGAGGSYTFNNNVPVSPGIITVTVGAGGTGVSANNGNPGGTSSFGALVTAAGGGGGFVNTGITNATINGGGAPTTTGITYNGGAGGTGDATTGNSGTSGGGGGGAGSGGAGGAATINGGNGGTPDGGDGADGTGSSGTGAPATLLSGGGSGGRNGSSGSSRTGGAGFRGQVIVYYYLLSSTTTSSACAGGSSTVTLNATAANLPTGTYTVTYDLTGANTASGSTATMTVAAAGKGTFITSALSNSGSTTVTVTKISNTSTITGGISANNSASITVNSIPSTPTITAGGPTTFCAGGSVTLTSSAGTSYSWSPGGAITQSISATASGSYTVTVTTGGCPSAPSVATNVTVNPAPVVSLSASSVCVGSTANILSPTSGGTWVSSNPSIASVTNAGVVTAGSTAGSVTFTFTSSTTGCSSTTPALTVDATCQVITLTQPAQLTAIISGGGATICSGASTPITVTITGGTAPYVINGVQQVGAGPFTINVSPTSTTTYDNTNITVTDANSCATSSITGSETITVNQTAAITSVTVPPTICIGGTTTATANGVVLGGGTGAWSITGSNTINSSGNITAGATPGPPPATVTYTITGGCGGTVSKSANIFVIPNSSVGSVTGTSPLCVGATATYTANSLVQSGGSGSWSSDNTAVATVDANGVVTAHQDGTANIIYTITGGCNGPASAQQSVTVNAAPQITTQPSAQTVTYGVASVSYSVVATGTPAPTYQWQVNTGSGFNNISGETNSTLTIANPTVAMSVNSYQVVLTNSCGSVTSTPASLMVNPLPITVTAYGQTKVYGTSDPSLTYQITNGALVGSDAFIGALTRDGGEDVGTYTINQGTLALSTNYNLTYSGANLSITQAPITVTADAQTKVYGTSDPSLTYQITNGALVGADAFTGALSRDAGEDVGTYAINQGTLALSTNYSLTYSGANLSITQAPITVTADAQTKVYGTTDPTFTYQITNGALVGSDAFTGALIRDAGEDVGSYAIHQGTLALSTNYNLTYSGANLSITQALITITPNTASKNYGSIYTFANDGSDASVTSGALQNSDAIATDNAASTGSLATASVGSYDITLSAVTIKNGATDVTGNYSVTYATAVNGLSVGQVPLTITANDQVKCFGQLFNFAGTEITTAGLLNSDAVSSVTLTSDGAPTPATPAPYAIVPSNPVGSGLGNYNINYVNGTFTVNANPTAVISGTTAICNGSSTTLTLTVTGTGTINGVLSDGTTFSGTGPSITVNVSPTNTTTYTVASLSDANSCSAELTDLTGSAVITVNNDATISLTSSSADATLCINTALTNNITYSIGGGATNATIAGLPNGLTGTYNTGVFTISGTPTVSGTFTYVISTVGPCDIPTATGTIIVNGNSSIVLNSATQTTAQTVCINNPITNIEYTIDDGATGGNATGLPNGLTGVYNSGTFTISGTPTESGTFNYTVTATGPCEDAVLTGTITVNANSTLTPTSIAGTYSQTVCINNAISAITCSIGGGGTGAFISAGALPDGVTGSFNSGVFTIIGTPTESGTFNYTITTTGPCVNPTLSGSITVNANSTIILSSATGSDGQTVCINNAISGITYAIGGGGTSASITAGALPAGVTGSYSGGVFTISGTPTESGSFNYTVTTGGPCVNTSIIGTITVNADATIILTSGAGSNAQNVCLNNQMNSITYSVGGSGTGATISGTLPIGVTGSFSGGVFTISGVPSQSGVFNYTVTTTGPCVKPIATGTITVNPLPVVNPVANVSYCDNASGAAINFSSPTPGTATYNWSSTADIGFGTTGNGNISSFTANNNSNSVVTATITVTATINECTGATTTFTITVNPKPVVNLVSNLTYCNNDNTSAIVFGSPTTGGTVSYSWTSSVNIGFGLNGTGNISGFTAANTSINPISTTVTVTPTLNGCTGDPVSFTLTVNPAANAGSISGSSTICTGSTSQLGTNGALGGTWTSTNTSVATVNATTGLVTGVGTGTTTIFYTVSNTCGASSASFSVSVNPVATAGTISGASTLCVGSSTLLISNGNSGGTWYSTSPTISISPTGMVTGLSAGPATIYYYVANSCGFSVATPFTMNITAGANPGTIIGSSTMCAGAANLFMTTGTTGGTWNSSNPAVAIIDGPSGFALTMNPGTTTISYTVASNSCSAGSQTAYFSLTVNPGGNAGLITGTANICAGTSTNLNTSGSSGGTWSSGNTSIATVDPNTGMVTGVAPGNAIITYHVSNSCGTTNATFTMFVSPGANAGTISGPSVVCAGSAINLTTNGTTGGTWSSSNTSAAIVDSYGNVAGQGAGATIITYTVSSACATSSISTTITVNPLPIAGSISGSATVCAGLSTTFSSNGNSGGSWSSSNTAVASVNSASGVVTGVSEGNSTITYTVTNSCGTVSQSAPITVNPVLSAGTINGGSAVCMSSTLDLNSSGNSGGAWSSSNTAVATIDASTGVITPVAPGNTIITYALSNVCGNSSATQPVTVTALPNAGTITGAAAVCTGSATTYSSNGTSGGTWNSSNTSVATVDAASGVVTAVAPGSTTITYSLSTSCGNATATANVTVNPLASAGTISGPNAVCVNANINLSSPISGGTWSSSSNSIATVNTSGQVTGVSSGNVTITYSVTTSCGTNVATYAVTVNASPNAGMIPGIVTSVCVGSNVTLTNSGGMPGGIWKSINPARATVDPVTGEVTGVSAGYTIIAYTVTNSCGTSSANLPFTVKALPNAGTISGLTSVCVSANINLSASGDAGGGWTSNNTGVATVDPNTGVVTGISQGTATIIYTVGSNLVCGTSAATYLITVNPLANAGSISGTTTVCAGLATTLTSNGSIGGTWSSSNPAVATVNSVSGVVTGISAGLATINYTVSNICGSTSATATVTVNPVANAGTISGATSVCVGSNINLSSSVSGGTWSNSTPSVASVDANTGVVTGVGAGNTTITYTVTTSCGTASTTYTITVNPLPVAPTISGTFYLCIGSNTTLSGSVSGGSWSSSNTSAATINPTTGVVTGIGAGSTTITYTVSTGCGNASKSEVVIVGALPNAGTVSGISTLCVGSTSIFTSNGTGGGSWSSNNTAAATVDPVTGVVTGAGMGSATISYTVSSTCGSSVSSANITISALPDAGLISGGAAICAGSSTTLTSSGTAGGSWSSNNNLVATVNSSGVVTGVNSGSATITYTVVNTCGTASTTANITINALPNAGTVSGAASVCSGVTTAFTSTGTGGGSWSSNNTAAATVDPVTGAVTGVAAGSATITYTVSTPTCGSASSSANITINPSPDPGTISGAASVCAGSNTTFTSNGMINGTWSSNNTAVATVNSLTGEITGVSAGTTTISYTVTNGCGTASASMAIIVNPLPDAGIIAGAATVCVGSATTFTTSGLSGGTWSSDNAAVATVDPVSGLVTGVYPGNANITYTKTTPCGTVTATAAITVIILPDAGTVSGAATVCAGSTTAYASDGLSGGTWNSVTPSVATVDPNTGEVTGVSAGNATIVYTFTNGCGTSTATKTIVVDPLPNAGTISGAPSVCIGSIATYSSNGLSGGSWSSSDANIASVDPNTGVLTGVASGNAIITYTSTTPCGTTSISASISVIPIPNAGVVSGNTTLCVGSNTTYTSSGMSGGTWSSVTPSVATVDANTGVVTGVSVGNATIVYTFTNSCGSPTASQMITVNPLPNAGTLTGAATVCAGSQATYTTDGLPGGSWSSNNSAVATVDANTGVVIGVAAGNAQITYTSTTPCGTLAASANITVNPIVNAGTVSGSTTLCVGSTTPYTTNGTTGGTWSSVTPSVATVNATTGVVTGVSVGNATIIYTVNGCGTSSASQLITVSLAATPGTISGPTAMCAGSSVTFTRSGGTGGGTWTSSNTGVATVNSSGKVTAIANGTTVISYSVSSGCGSFSSTVSVTVGAAPNISVTNITANTDPNSCSATITIGSNITQTGSPATTIDYRIGFFWWSYPIAATHTFYRGTTPVWVRASNSCGTVWRLFLVTVVDNQPPVINCVPNATRTANGNSNKYSVQGYEFNATASDGCGVASKIYSLSGATVDNFDWNNRSLNNVRLNVGTTIITWKATDVNGNVSTCSTQVTVNANPGHFQRFSNEPTLKVKVAPNPTSDHFTLQFSSQNPEDLKIIVTDQLGRTVEKKTSILSNSTLEIGGKYRPGIYILQTFQGDYMVPLKLIKEGR